MFLAYGALYGYRRANEDQLYTVTTIGTHVIIEEEESDYCSCTVNSGLLCSGCVPLTTKGKHTSIAVHG